MARYETKYLENGVKVSGYELLAIAVCKAAADDYARKLKKSDKAGKKTEGAKAIERFFLSEWGELLSFSKGELILELLREKHAKKTYVKRNASKKRGERYV